ncbi:SNARE associated protein [Caldalkalibacillus thermarum TA2.A1]|uniref:TVP38/TMEM64 family membrane protein n=1 Tax=Caldalkalibacillus thermarum (strain TA2.A1) TaxID=986075 RepID=F5LB64_CALTT|nr:VTT domain-containing protein [Caldalkalibacillus thermarum]EGL81419.1 SNARE associated protein [Caldalkalibacillus thermarum TA2.A1]
MKVVLLILFIFFIVIVLVNQREWVIHFKEGDWDTLRQMMGNEWGSILMVTMGFMLLQNVISLIPFLLLTMFNIWFFGFIYGYMWSLAGNFLGSMLVFYMARYGFHNWAQKYNHLTFKQKIENNGFMTVLLCRLFPFMPASVVNIVGGLSNIKARDYLSATLIGNTIFVFILSLFSIGVISLEHQYVIYLVLTTLIIGVVALCMKKRFVTKESH